MFFSTPRHRSDDLSKKIMISKEESTNIVNFMTSGAVILVIGRGHISHIVKLHYFFKNLHPGIDHTN